MAERNISKPIQDPIISPYPKTDNVGTPLLTFINNLPEGVSYYYIGGATTIDGLPTTVIGDRIIKFYKYNVNLTDIIVFGASNKILKGKCYVGVLSWSNAFPLSTDDTLLGNASIPSSESGQAYNLNYNILNYTLLTLVARRYNNAYQIITIPPQLFKNLFKHSATAGIRMRYESSGNEAEMIVYYESDTSIFIVPVSGDNISLSIYGIK